MKLQIKNDTIDGEIVSNHGTIKLYIHKYVRLNKRLFNNYLGSKCSVESYNVLFWVIR